MTELGLKFRGPNLKTLLFVIGKVLKRENKEIRRKEKIEKKKNRFKLNKLILYVYSNSFHLFLSII